MKRHSLRTQLVVWNGVSLALLLAVLGVTVYYAASAAILASVDRQLADRTRPHRFGGMGGPPSQGGQFRGRFDRPPSSGYGSSPLDGGPPDGGPPDGGPPNGGSNGGPPDGGPDGRPPNAGLDGGPPGRGPDGPPPSDNDPYRPRVFNASGSNAVVPWDAKTLAQAAHGQPVFSTVRTASGRLRIISRPFEDGGPSGRVMQAAYPLTDADRALAGLRRVELTLIPVALLCAGLVGWLLTGRVLRRVADMTRKVAHMDAEELSERLPVAGSDEFSALAGTFNGLLARLETAWARQRQLMQQQQRFTADASHELKTPLTVIRAASSMTLSGNPSLDEYRDSMTDIDGAAQNMACLVQDLLLLARADAGQIAQERVSLPLRNVAARAVARARRPGTAPLTIVGMDDAPAVWGHADELTRAFSNLLDNAWQHTPPEGTVTLRATADADTVTVEVADTGPGIDPQHLSHLGERFYRVDSARARRDGGTGLGLSICKGIVAAHGGTLTFHSTPGVGTTVTVTLPRHEPRPAYPSTAPEENGGK